MQKKILYFFSFYFFVDFFVIIFFCNFRVGLDRGLIRSSPRNGIGSIFNKNGGGL